MQGDSTYNVLPLRCQHKKPVFPSAKICSLITFYFVNHFFRTIILSFLIDFLKESLFAVFRTQERKGRDRKGFVECFKERKHNHDNHTRWA